MAVVGMKMRVRRPELVSDKKDRWVGDGWEMDWIGPIGRMPTDESDARSTQSLEELETYLTFFFARRFSRFLPKRFR